MTSFLALALLAAAPPRPFSLAPPPSWVERIDPELDAPPPAAGVSDGVYHLLSDVQTRVGATREMFNHYAKAVFTSSGLEAASQVSIEFDPSYRSLTLHFVRLWRRGTALGRLDPGKIQILQREPGLESQLYDGRLSVVLVIEDLRVGDVLDVAYTLKGDNPVFEGRYSNSFDVEWSVPVHRLRWRLLWPAGRTLHIRDHGTSIAPVVRETPSGREYVWESWHIPPVRDDGQVPNWYDQWGWVQLSEWGTWQEVASWGQRLFDTPQPLPGDLAARVAEWRAKDDASAIISSLRFVQDEVRYLGIELGVSSHRPAPPPVVFKRRFGDCKDKTLLFCAIARALGAKAEPALVHSTLGRALDEWLPTPDAFNHVVSRVELGGRTYWLDPTLSEQGGRLGAVYFPDYERALPLEPGTAGLVRLPVQPPRSPTRSVHDRFVVKDVKGPADFTVETRFEGDDADGMRASLERRSRDEIARSYRDFYVRSHPSLRSAGDLVVADDRVANVITVREHYTIPEFFSPVEGVKDRREAEVDPVTLRSYLQKPAPNRSAPLSVPHPVFVRHVIDLALPEAWPSDPESATLSDEALRFSYQARYDGPNLELKYEYQSLADAVPASRVASHVKTLNDVLSWVGYRLTYPPRKVAHAGPNWPVRTTAALLVVLSLGGAMLAYRFRHTPPAAPPPPLMGLGSGLLLVVGALAFGTAALSMRTLHSWASCKGTAWTERTVVGAASYHAAWAPVRLTELGVQIALLTGVALLWLLLMKRRRRFRGAFVALALAACLFLYADAVALALLPGGDLGVVRSAVRDALLGLAPLFTAGLYLLASRRAHSTFSG